MEQSSELTAAFIERRRQLVSAAKSNVEVRKELSQATDAWLRDLSESVLAQSGFALVAVGGLGRGDVCAGSDLDLLLLHSKELPQSELAATADRLWYPIWDTGLRLDHSVRNIAQARSLAADDFKVLLGLLDARVLWGDEALLEGLRSSVLADWRAQAAKRLPELLESVEERRARSGDLAHLLEPDLKESYGGLRELTIMRAVAASWLTDLPHGELTAAADRLLSVRDSLHRTTGRASDRLVMQEQAAVASALGFASDDELLRAVSRAGRRVAAVSDQMWHRVRGQLSAKKVRTLRRPRQERTPLADGVVVHEGQAVLAVAANLAEDAGLGLRAAAAAAQAGLTLSPATVDLLVKKSRPVQIPWPSDVRNSLVSLLGAGAALIPVWESLDLAGYIEKLIPHWAAIQSLPQRNSLHIYTVDRHSLEAVAHASRLAREVARPDLLLIAALFHDIGKGQPNHCDRGALLMREIAPTLGFGPADTHVLVKLVQHHLLLAEAATARDLDDPATVQTVLAAVEDENTLELLCALTLADSAAAAPSVLTTWKERLIRDLTARVRATFAGTPQPQGAPLSTRFEDATRPAVPDVSLSQDGDSLLIRIKTPDKVGLLSEVASVMALQGLEVQSAEVDTVDDLAFQEWRVHPLFGAGPDLTLLRQALSSQLAGQSTHQQRVASLQPARRAKGFVPPPPRVRFLPGAATTADVLEVRAHDAPALLFRVTAAVAEVGLTVVSAKVATLGSEVVDVLYVRLPDGRLLEDADRQAAVAAVEAAINAQ